MNEKNAPASAVSPILSRVDSRFFLQYGMIWAFIIVLIGGGIFYPRLFDINNIQNLLSQSAPVGIVAVGMTFVMIGGGFDLSVGAIFALGAVIFAMHTDDLGLWGAGLLVAVVCGLCGVLNALIVTKLRVNAFVATLGSGSVIGGSAYIYSGSAPQVPNDFNFTVLGSNYFAGWPISIWIMLFVFVAGGVFLSRSVYGRSIYAIGGNSEAARLSGLRVDMLRGSTYVLTGICSGIGGMIIASRLGVGQADMGSSIALDAIAIVVIGGTSLLGGEGAMWRTAIGLLIIATITNIFDSLAINTNYQLVAKGLIVICAVALDLHARRIRR